MLSSTAEFNPVLARLGSTDAAAKHLPTVPEAITAAAVWPASNVGLLAAAIMRSICEIVKSRFSVFEKGQNFILLIVLIFSKP